MDKHPPGNSLSRVFTGLLLGCALLAGGCFLPDYKQGVHVKQECSVSAARIAAAGEDRRKLTISPDCEVTLEADED